MLMQLAKRGSWASVIGLAACGGGGGEGAPAATLPTVSLTLGAASVNKGDATTLSWASGGAMTCSASGAWSGTMPTSGSVSVSHSRTGSFTYGLTCTNADGATSASTTLSVVARTAANYFRLEDTGLVILNDNPNTTRTLNSIENLDLNGDGLMDSVLVGPEFEIGNSSPKFMRQSVHVVLGGSTATAGASLFPSGRPSYVVSNYAVSHDFNGDGRRDLFIPEFGADTPPYAGGQSGAWLSGGDLFAPATVATATAAMHGASAGRVAGKRVVFAHAVCCGAEAVPFLYVYEDGEFKLDRSLLPELVTQTYPTGEVYRLWTASAITDVDADGFDDLILGNFAAVRDNDPRTGNYVVFGTGSGWRTGATLRLPDPQGVTFTDLTALSLSAIDVDGDGRKDLVLGYTDHYETRGIQILHNAGSRTFADVSAAMLGAEAYLEGSPSGTLPTVDLNGDDCIDLVEPELVSLAPRQRGRILINDCDGKFVNANAALASVLSRADLVNLFPFTDQTGRTSFYLPVVELPSAGSGGLHGTRYKKLKNLANLPTPVGGQIVFD